LKLSQLLHSLPEHRTRNAGNVPQDPDIGMIRYRSTDVRPGDLFVAVAGFKADGHRYVGDAVQRGAAAVVTERPVDIETGIQVQVPDSRQAMAALAAAFFGRPSDRLTIVAVTGTNGKTTTAFLLESILRQAGFNTGVIGTINYRYNGQTFANPMTTPESVDLQQILSEMVRSGVTHVVMETSSHAITLDRVHDCRIQVGVFTNLSQDHLDFHDTMEAYWDAKQKLFRQLLDTSDSNHPAAAVINTNDNRGKALVTTLINSGPPLRLLTVGNSPGSDIEVVAADITLNGIDAAVKTPAGDLKLHSPMVGEYNLENIICAVGAGAALGLPMDVIKAGIENFDAVPGRLEPISDQEGRFLFVDYAHTPDALDNVLRALTTIAAGRLICVFGCGGDRDRTKRPLMGAIAGQIADLTVVTSDNPRTESPEEIIADVLKGLAPLGLKPYGKDLTAGFTEKGYLAITNRRDAIRTGISAARSGDTVLIAGKGHETYQIIGDRKLPFDDRAEVRCALEVGHA
jgi:UDP-N-acetylmuramoyl-L-alanyl-D-glutamate--2,6-diaminopimelate ligase